MSPALLPEHDASVRRQLASAVGEDRVDAAWAAYVDARIAGLCHEGAWEVALGARAESTSGAREATARRGPTTL